MKLFSCPFCGKAAYFENVTCAHCGSAIGYEPISDILALAGSRGRAAWQWKASWKYCANHRHGVCNWLLPSNSRDTLCLACSHNMVIPDLDEPGNLALWARMENAKHRLFHTILRLGLPLMTRRDHAEGLGFEFLQDEVGGERERVLTGHDRGLITIALTEADDAEREQRRKAMGEPYRTLLGHFRHETGHWYWDRLVRDSDRLNEFRNLFGDEQLDYQQSLSSHYHNGPPPGWQETHVSSYATAHPWEDFAETFAHYFHILDTLHTARHWGVSTAPLADSEGVMSVTVDFNPFDRAVSLQNLVDKWLPLSAALNSLNRSMGQKDLYPFVLGPVINDKLAYVHDIVSSNRVYGR